MRRNDREVTDQAIISRVIKECEIVHIGFADENKPYIVPLNFGIEEKDGERTLYFHGAVAGRKLDLTKKLGWAAFEMETEHAVYGVENDACSYTSRFKCVMGEGEISVIEDEREKLHALDMIMEHYEPGKKFTYKPEILKKVVCFKLIVKDISCKFHA